MLQSCNAIYTTKSLICIFFQVARSRFECDYYHFGVHDTESWESTWESVYSRRGSSMNNVYTKHAFGWQICPVAISPRSYIATHTNWMTIIVVKYGRLSTFISRQLHKLFFFFNKIFFKYTSKCFFVVSVIKCFTN